MDRLFPASSNGSDSICPLGDPEETKNINEALIILSRTNPEIYKNIKDAKDVFVIRTVDFSTPDNETPDRKQKTMVFFTASYVRIDQLGAFGVSLNEHNALRAVYSPGAGFTFSRGGMNSDEGERVNISEEEADSLLKLKDPVILVQTGLSGKKLARVLAHEFGHADYISRHKARAEFYPADPALLAHDRGNPDGDAADAAEQQFSKRYKRAIRNDRLRPLEAFPETTPQHIIGDHELIARHLRLFRVVLSRTSHFG
jgi:hypothetical protein